MFYFSFFVTCILNSTFLTQWVGFSVKSQSDWRLKYSATAANFLWPHLKIINRISFLITPNISVYTSRTSCVKLVVINLILKGKHLDNFSPWSTAPSGSGPPHYRCFAIKLRHTTLCRNPLDELLAWRRALYLTTQNTHNRQTDRHLCTRRNSNPRSQKRAAAEPRRRTRGYRD